MKKIIRLFKDICIRFMTLFSVAIFTYAIVDFVVFKQMNISFGYIMFGAIFIFLLSCGLTFFYRLNFVPQIVQVITTYVVVLFAIYVIGFLNGWFNFKRFDFLVYSLIVNIVVVIGLVVLFIIRRMKQIENLNLYLKKYKERQNEKDL